MAEVEVEKAIEIETLENNENKVETENVETVEVVAADIENVSESQELPEAPSEIHVDMSNDYVELPENEQPTNETAIKNDINSGVTSNEESQAINAIEDPMEKTSALINLVNVSVENVLNKQDIQSIKDLAIATDKLLSDNSSLDIGATFKSLSDNLENDELKQRLQSLEVALNHKHEGNKELIKYDEFMDNPYLSYYNVVIQNNIHTLRSMRPIKNDEKLEAFCVQYNKNGAFKEYIDSKVIENDFNNSFSAKATQTGLTSMNLLGQIAKNVCDTETITSIIDNMHNVKIKDRYVSDEAERYLAALASKQEIELAGNTVKAHDVFKEELLSRFEDISVQQMKNGQSLPIITIALRSACIGANDKEQKIMLGDVLKGVQGLADNGIVEQDYVKNAYQSVASVLSGSALAYVMSNEEIEKYEVKMTRMQTQERTKAIKKEIEEEKKATKSNKMK